MANIDVDVHFNNDYGTDCSDQERLRQQKVIFDARFWRCYRSLRLFACRGLDGPERAEKAIGSCWRRASRHDGKSSIRNDDEERFWREFLVALEKRSRERLFGKGKTVK
jgi:hypothetical protein